MFGYKLDFFVGIYEEEVVYTKRPPSSEEYNSDTERVNADSLTEAADLFATDSARLLNLDSTAPIVTLDALLADTLPVVAVPSVKRQKRELFTIMLVAICMLTLGVEVFFYRGNSLIQLDLRSVIVGSYS